jgi:hypothetical protein
VRERLKVVVLLASVFVAACSEEGAQDPMPKMAHADGPICQACVGDIVYPQDGNETVSGCLYQCVLILPPHQSGSNPRVFARERVAFTCLS